MKSRRDIPFIATLAAAVLLTIGFTIYYVWRASNPLELIREHIYVDYNGREQIITGVYEFKNHVPVNITVPLEYSISKGAGLGEAIIEDIIFSSAGINQVMEYSFVDENLVSFELGIPPFSGCKLAIKYRQLATGNMLIFNFKSGIAWGIPRREAKAFIKLPEGHKVRNLHQSGGKESDMPGWDIVIDLKSRIPGETVELFISPEDK